MFGFFPIPIWINRIIPKKEEPIDNTKYVPKQILQQAYQNTNVQSDRPIITKEDGYEVRTHKCGCVFKTALGNSFGYHNHWCEQHAPRGTFDMPNIPRQTTKEADG